MKKVLAISAALAALPLAMQTAKADPLSWTEVGIGYNQADSGDDDITALDVRGSIGLGQLFHVQAGFTDGTADGSPDEDFDGIDIRAGVHPGVGEKTQAVVDLIYFDYSGEGDNEEDGYGLGFGVRHQMGDQFEARAQIDYIRGTEDPGDGDFTNTTYSFGGRYYWTPAIFTGVTVFLGGSEAFSIAGGGDVIRLDAGWSFGGDVM